MPRPSNVHALPMRMPSTTSADDTLERALSIIRSYEALIAEQALQIAQLRAERDRALELVGLRDDMRRAIETLRGATEAIGCLAIIKAPRRAAFGGRLCTVCGEPYAPTGPAQKRCPTCQGRQAGAVMEAV